MVDVFIQAIIILIQTLAIVFLSPLIIGIIRKIQAHLQSRKGASIFQPYYDLRKLFSKDSVVSKNASWVFRITPYLCMGIVVTIALMVPVFFSLSLDILGNVIVLVGLLAAFRFFMALAALDVNSTFTGMGSSREMMISAIAEPTTLLCIFTVALITKTTYLGGIAQTLALSDGTALTPSLFLAFFAFFIVMMAENARIPFDNPTTHLELTMVHEAMILEYSGKSLGLMEWASWTKLLVFMTLLANMFFPWGIATDFTVQAVSIGVLVYLLKVIFFAAIVAYVESSISKLRLFKVPNMLGIAFALSLVAVVTYYIIL
jgi:formate hydrogenlyase subunit 4